jgi:YVTN family beta-propeller protein
LLFAASHLIINQMKRLAFFTALIIAGTFFPSLFADDFQATSVAVGRNGGALITPVNQIVTPAGTWIGLPGMRPQALAMSPDGRILVTAGLTHEMLVLDPGAGTILQHVPLPPDAVGRPQPVSSLILNPDNGADLSFTGLAFSPDGSRIYLSNVNGDIKVFSVSRNGVVAPQVSLPLPPANAPLRQEEIPAGIAVSPDGKKLYVAGNLSNRLMELDAVTGKVLRTWNVGVAPLEVVRAGHKIYVSNWGGRRPDVGSVAGPAGKGTLVRVDARSIASEGSVSLIDLSDGAVAGGASVPASRGENLPAASPRWEIVIGPHACALALSPNGKYLVAASAGSDMLSVIDTRSDEVIETLTARQNPGDLFGAQPVAMAFDKSGKKLFVCNGTQNAVAEFQFEPRDTKLLGLIPVGWFPASVAYDKKRDQLCVANLKDIASTPQPAKFGADGFGFNTHQYCGSLSLVPVPSKSELATYTEKALANLRYPLLVQARLPARPDRQPVPVPERVGEPSVFKHVIYIIKENRSYDQVFGDVKEGNGDASLCNFGERVTPNLHKLVREYTLLDNTYCSSVLSADGHNWADSAFASDYVERSFAGWPRSYPAGGFGLKGADALAYASSGFIWDDALAHGRSVHVFGEFTTSTKRWKNPVKKGKIGFAESWQDFASGADQIEYTCEPDIETLRPIMEKEWSSWDLSVPDGWRAARFIQRLKEFEMADNLPALTILWLPNDHTSATAAGHPTPAAQVADNDLAMGRVIEAVSHSKFWKDTCIFAIEDDPQNGWDHVSGYRTTAFVVSAWTKRNAVVSTQYNHTSLLRTMGLMLGLPPMNQMDATATPMFDCFTNTPDYTAFDAVTNTVPLDEMNPSPKKIADAQQRRDAIASSKLPLEKPDQCNEDVLNRILWRATMNGKPYPEWAVKVADED